MSQKKPDIMTPREFSAKAANKYGETLEPVSSDEVTTYKNAAEVLSMIRDGTVQASKLTPQDRRPVVAYLRLEGYSTEDISRLFDVAASLISKDLKLLSKDRAKIMKGLSLLEVAGRLSEIARHLSRKARREGSYGTAWKIEKELIESLQNLGFLYRAPKTLGIASIHANVQEGHSLLKEKLGDEKDKVVDALGSILSSLSEGDRKVRITHEQEEEPQRSDDVIEISGT